jgi:cell division protein FtsL
MSFSSIFQRKLRGFRVVEVSAFGLLCVMMLGVYFAKTSAGGERARIDQVERRIAEEKSQIRMLDAEVAYLERPRRVGHLAESYLQMQPLKAERETSVEALSVVAAKPVLPVPPPAEAPAT